MRSRKTSIALAAVLLGLFAYTVEREPDITVTAQRIPPSEMSFDDMEFMTHVIDCGKRLYEDGQRGAAWPYLRMGARYGDVDSQLAAANMLSRGEDVPQNWNAAVGWLGVAADGNLKPDARRTLREARKSLCGEREPCGEQFDAIVAEYVARYGRDASGMACRRGKGERGRGVSSLRINRGSKEVVCIFPRLFTPRDILADADLEAATARPGTEPVVTPGGTERPSLAAAFPGVHEFALRVPDGPSSGRDNIRCPKLGDE